MLKAIMKKFSNAAKEEVNKMVEPQTEQPQAAVLNTAEFSALAAQMATQTEAFTAIQSQFAELTAKYEEAQAQLASIEAEKADMVVAAKAKVQATRQEKLEAIMGTTKAPGVADALASLDDATFETVLGTYAASYKAEAKSAAFVEVGVSAEAAVVTAPEESLEMKIIKAKQKSN